MFLLNWIILMVILQTMGWFLENPNHGYFYNQLSHTLVHTCWKSPILHWSYNNTTRWKVNKVAPITFRPVFHSQSMGIFVPLEWYQSKLGSCEVSNLVNSAVSMQNTLSMLTTWFTKLPAEPFLALPGTIPVEWKNVHWLWMELECIPASGRQSSGFVNHTVSFNLCQVSFCVYTRWDDQHCTISSTDLDQNRQF